MIPTPEQIAAFADDQLDPAERERVGQAVAADPALQAQVAAHRALRARLAAHFAPVAAAPVPDRLAALLAPATSADAAVPQVIDLAAARERRRSLPRWSWIAGPALAASLVLALVLRPHGDGREGYAGTALAAALDQQLTSSQPAGAPVRVLLSFRDAGGRYCRAYAAGADGGIACRDPAGWRVVTAAAAGVPEAADYRQAGSDAAAIMAATQAMAAGPALDAAQERTARAQGWRPAR